MIKNIMKKGIAALLCAGMVLGVFPASTLVEAQAAIGSSAYEPIDISSSLNGNAIWGATESSSYVHMDDSAFLYSAARFVDGGLPINGEITMPDTKVEYKLATGDDSSKAYDGNDCIRLTSSSKSRTMDLRTIGVYQNIYVLATAGGPGSGHYADFKVTLNYTSGKSVETNYRLYDWYDTTAVAGVEKYYNIRRINNGYTTVDSTSSSKGVPVLHSAAIQVDNTRLLKSITFTMNGKDGNSSDTSGLYCCVFAVTGATPEGVPNRPNAIAATAVNKSQDGPCFTANWESVKDANGYRLDVATDKNFTSILSDYNNKDVGNTNSYKVTGLRAETTYYYRVRAYNSSGQSLSSNRIATGVPEWASNAGITDDQAIYDVENDTLTIIKDINLTDTVNVPTGEKTTIVLTGNSTVTAPAGKSAINASGANTELTVSGDGKIIGGAGAAGEDGSPAIDISGTSGNAALDISGNTTVIGGKGGDATSGSGGAGGAAIKGNSNSSISIAGNGSGTASAIGGDGGKGAGTNGNGGNGGAAIETDTGNSNVKIDNASLTGGNGGDGSGTGAGGDGGSGVSGGKITSNGADIIGGDGGRAEDGKGGAGGTGIENPASGSTVTGGTATGGNGGESNVNENSGAAGAGASGSGSSQIPNAKPGESGHKHTYTSSWIKGETSHWHVCSICGIIIDSTIAEHTGKWSVETPATKEQPGKKIETCTVCGYKMAEEEIPQLPKDDSDRLTDVKQNLQESLPLLSVSNDMSEEKIRTKIEEEIKTELKKNGLGEEAEVTIDLTKTDATKDADGKITGTITIRNGEDLVTIPYNKVIPKIDKTPGEKLEDVIGKIENKLGTILVNNESTPENIQSQIERIMQEEGIDGASVGVADLNKEKATTDSSGKMTGTITVTVDGETKEIPFERPIPKIPTTDEERVTGAADIIGEQLALGNPNMAGKSEETIKQEIRDMLANAGYTGVEPDMTDVIYTEPSEDADGNYSGNLVFKCGDQEVTLPFSQNLPATGKSNDKKLEEAEQIVKSALSNMPTLTNQATVGDLAEVIQKKLEEAGLTDVSISASGLQKESATSRKSGSISGTLTISCGDKESSLQVNQVIPKLPSTDAEKVEQAKSELQDKLSSMDTTAGISKDDVEQTIKDTLCDILENEGYSKEDAWKIASDTLDKAKESTGSDKLQITLPTNENDGSVTGKLDLKLGDKDLTMDLNQTIPKLENVATDLSQKVLDAANLVKGKFGQFSIDNEDRANEEAIKKAAEKQVKDLLTKAGYTSGDNPVEVLEFVWTTVTPATTSKEGELQGKITFVCGGKKQTITVSLAVPKIPQTEEEKTEEAKRIENALQDLNITDINASDTETDNSEKIKEKLTNEIKDQLKQNGYSDSDIENTTIDTDGLNIVLPTSDTNGNVTGDIKIKIGDKEMIIPVDKDLDKLPKSDKEKVSEAKDVIRDRLPYITVSNKDENGADLMERIKAELEKQGITDVDVTLKDYKMSQATKDSNGFVSGTIEIKKGKETISYPFEKVIPKVVNQENPAGVLESTKQDVENKLKEDLNTGNANPTPVRSQEELQKKVDDLLKDSNPNIQDIVVKDFKYTEPAKDKPGKVEGTITVITKDGQSFDVPYVEEVPYVMSDEETKKKTEEIINTGINKPSNETSASDILKEMEKTLKENGITDATLTMKDYKKTDATSKKDGQISGTMKVTLKDGTSFEIPYEQTIPKLTTKSVAEIKEALDTVKKTMLADFKPVNSTTKETFMEAIRKLLEKEGLADATVILVDDLFDIDPATENADGTLKARIKVVSGKTSVTRDFYLTIPKIDKVDNGSGLFTVEGTEKQISAPKTEIKSDVSVVKDAVPGIGEDQTVNVYLKVETTEIMPQDRARRMIEAKAESENVKVEQYVDISMIRKVTTTTSQGESETETEINNLNKKIELQITIPEEIRGANRTYKLLHYHAGDLVAEVVDGTYDPATYTFTFWTDKFSTYAIAYTETATGGNNNNASDNNGGVKEDNTKPDDSQKPDANPKMPMLLRAKTGNKKVNLNWENVTEATGYEVYACVCDGSKNYKKVATTKKTKFTLKKLNNTKSYKFYVRAYKIVDGTKVYIDKSIVVHVAMKANAYTNAKTIKNVKKSCVLSAGKKTGIRAGLTKENKNKKLLAHATKFRYYSGNTSVATVSRDGVITAKGSGICIVYVVANNGVCSKIKVTVK